MCVAGSPPFEIRRAHSRAWYVFGFVLCSCFLAGVVYLGLSGQSIVVCVVGSVICLIGCLGTLAELVRPTVYRVVIDDASIVAECGRRKGRLSFAEIYSVVLETPYQGEFMRWLHIITRDGVVHSWDADWLTPEEVAAIGTELERRGKCKVYYQDHDKDVLQREIENAERIAGKRLSKYFPPVCLPWGRRSKDV